MLPGFIEIIPGRPAAPRAMAFTLNNEINADPAAEPAIAPINGYLSFKFTPNIAGSVIPNNAEIPAADATPLILLSFVFSSTAMVAAPWATFDIAAIGKMNDPPVLAISANNCVSTAIKLWCIPVITIGA